MEQSGSGGERRRGLPQQVWRLAIAFAVIAIVFVVFRSLLVPPTFGERGHYRAAAIDSIVAHPVKYAGHEMCEACHTDVADTKGASFHRGLACETCHGPQAEHVGNPEEVKPFAPRDRAYCSLCHGYNPSRPTGFPQIDPRTHNPAQRCITCHNPHDPTPPHTPEECSGCHGEIARTKAVSPHAPLPCTQCHQADRRHMAAPRQVRPTKPTGRDFCGQCHATTAASDPGIPRVDLSTHNPGYVCWQCHYPHHPETK